MGRAHRPYRNGLPVGHKVRVGFGAGVLCKWEKEARLVRRWAGWQPQQDRNCSGSSSSSGAANQQPAKSEACAAERQQQWQQRWHQQEQRILHAPMNFDSPARLPATDRKSDVTLMGTGALLPRYAASKLAFSTSNTPGPPDLR